MPRDTEYASIRVFKFDPTIDKAPRYEEFQMIRQAKSVLSLLKDIHREYDSTLSFRWGCEGAGDCRCGACAIMVNGRPALACRKLSEKEMTVEPHPKFEIVKDLVVDFAKPKKSVSDIKPSVTIIIDNDLCVKCGDCVSICPVKVFTSRKGQIRAEGSEFCMGETCKQCVTYCQANALRIDRVQTRQS